MDRTLRRIAIFIFGLFVFAILWRLLFDQVTGVTKRQKEKGRYLPECNEIGMRMEAYFKINNAFPKTMKEIATFPTVSHSIRGGEILETNYTLASTFAEQAHTAGKSDVPIFFENFRYVGKEGGGFVGFAFPREIRWFEEARYKREWKTAFGTNHIAR